MTRCAEDSRVMPFEAIHNFRDYGNYRAARGRLRARSLWRSGRHKGATSADLAMIGQLDLATVIDLRNAAERARAPCPRPDRFAAAIVCAGDEAVTIAPHIAAGLGADSADAARTAMRKGYGEMPFRPVLVAALRAYFAALAENPGPSLVHCMAGKDRTGIAVALFHRLLGVHSDDIVADFLLTNVAGDGEARIAAGARTLRKAYGDGLADDVIAVLMTVEPEYIECAFDAITARCGSVETYLCDMLLVDEACRAAIERHVLA